METDKILAGLKHTNYNIRYSAISSLRTLIKDKKYRLNGSLLNKIFNCISLLLQDENWSVIQASILLLGELAINISNNVDLIKYINIILSNLIYNLGNIKGVIRRSSLSTLVIFVKKLYSAECILNRLISIGFVDNNSRIRQGSILVIPQIIGPNTNGVNLKLLIKSLIFRLIDDNPNVIISTQQSIAYLSKIKKKEFRQIQNNLDDELFTILTQHHQNIHNALLQQFQDSISYQEIQRFYNNINSNINNNNNNNNNDINLFKIIKPNILSNLLYHSRRHEWKNAIIIAQNISSSITNFCNNRNQIRKSNHSNHSKELILFLCKFLEIDSEIPVISDNSSYPQQSNHRYRFVLIFLKILETLINFDKNTIMTLTPYFIPRLIELMSYSASKINTVNKKSKEICKKLYHQSSPSNCCIIIQSYADVLQQTDNNCREFIITNMIIILLYHQHVQYSSNCIDFQIIINNLSKVLNQATSNLMYLIIELFAVINHKLNISLSTMLQNSTINANDMNILRERFKIKKLPILGKDGNITFRHKNTNTQNDPQILHHSHCNLLKRQPRQQRPIKVSGITSISQKHDNNNNKNNNNNITQKGTIPPRTHSAPIYHRPHASIASHLSLLKKRKSRAISANRAKSVGHIIDITTYVASDKLEMCINPERDIKNVTKQIQSKNWDERFAALNTIRKLAYHHKDILSPYLMELCRYIGIEINSLRSSLSRIAIITVKDLFICFGRKLESNKIIDALIPNLIRRSGEMSNEFISTAADKAFYAMIENISYQKSLNIMLSHSKSKSPTIRSKVAMYLDVIVSFAGNCIFNYRDYEKLIKTVGNFLSDGAVNTRKYTKKIIIRLNNLNKPNDFHRKLKTYLSQQQYKKLQNVIQQNVQQNSDININNIDLKRRLKGLQEIYEL